MGGSASITTNGDHLVGAARSNGSCAMPTRRSFVIDRMAGRVAAYPDTDGEAAWLDDTWGLTCRAGGSDLLLPAMEVLLLALRRFQAKQMLPMSHASVFCGRQRMVV